MITEKASDVNLSRQMQQDVRIIRKLKAAESKLPLLERLMHDLSPPDQGRSPVIVACLVGAIRAGKSTLFDTLTGRDVAARVSNQPTIYMPSNIDEAEFAVGSANVDYYCPGPGTPWQRLVLIDTPDVNSIELSHRAVAEQWALKSDVLIVVMHRQSIVELSSNQFVDIFKSRRHIICVLGYADMLTEESRVGLCQQIRQVLEEWGRPDAQVFVISAKIAKRDPAAAGDFNALVEYLRRLENSSEVMRIRRSNIAGAAAEFRNLISEIDTKVRPELNALVTDVKAIGNKLRPDLKKYLKNGLNPWRKDFGLALIEVLRTHWKGRPAGLALTSKFTGLAILLPEDEQLRKIIAGVVVYNLEKVLYKIRVHFFNVRLERSISEMLTQIKQEIEAEKSWMQMREKRLGVEWLHLTDAFDEVSTQIEVELKQSIAEAISGRISARVSRNRIISKIPSLEFVKKVKTTEWKVVRDIPNKLWAWIKTLWMDTGMMIRVLEWSAKIVDYVIYIFVLWVIGVTLFKFFGISVKFSETEINTTGSATGGEYMPVGYYITSVVLAFGFLFLGRILITGLLSIHVRFQLAVVKREVLSKFNQAIEAVSGKVQKHINSILEALERLEAPLYP